MRIRSGAGATQLIRVVATAPDSIEAQCALILIRSDELADKTGKAAQIKALQQLSDDHPGDPLLLWAVSNLAWAAGNYDLTIACCTKMSQMMDPGPPQLHNAWANSLDQLKRFDEALVHRRIALKLEEGAWSHAGLGRTLRHLGRHAEANSEFAKAVAISPIADYWEQWAYNLYDTRDYEQAIDRCQKATQSDPRRWRCWNLIGICQRELGHGDEAMAGFDKAMELAPHESLPFQNATKMLRALGRNDEADKVLDKWKLAGNTTPL